MESNKIKNKFKPLESKKTFESKNKIQCYLCSLRKEYNYSKKSYEKIETNKINDNYRIHEPYFHFNKNLIETNLNENEDGNKLINICKCKNYFHQNCLMIFILYTGNLKCDNCSVLFDIKSVNYFKFFEILLMNENWLNLFLFFIMLIFSILCILYLFINNLTDCYLHLRILLGIFFIFIGFLFLILIFKKIYHILKNKIPKTIIINSEKEENLSEIKNTNNNDIKKNNFLNSENFFSKNNLLIQKNDKINIINNSNYNQNLDQEIQTFRVNKKESLKIIESLKNFVNYNTFNFNRELLEIYESRSNFFQRINLSISKKLRDRKTFKELDDIDYEQKIVAKNMNLIIGSGAAYNYKEKTLKNSSLNILNFNSDLNETKNVENNKSNDIIDDLNKIKNKTIQKLKEESNETFNNTIKENDSEDIPKKSFYINLEKIKNSLSPFDHSGDKSNFDSFHIKNNESKNNSLKFDDQHSSTNVSTVKKINNTMFHKNSIEQSSFINKKKLIPNIFTGTDPNQIKNKDFLSNEMKNTKVSKVVSRFKSNLKGENLANKLLSLDNYKGTKLFKPQKSKEDLINNNNPVGLNLFSKIQTKPSNKNVMSQMSTSNLIHSDREDDNKLKDIGENKSSIILFLQQKSNIYSSYKLQKIQEKLDDNTCQDNKNTNNTIINSNSNQNKKKEKINYSKVSNEQNIDLSQDSIISLKIPIKYTIEVKEENKDNIKNQIENVSINQENGKSLEEINFDKIENFSKLMNNEIEGKISEDFLLENEKNNKENIENYNNDVNINGNGNYQNREKSDYNSYKDSSCSSSVFSDISSGNEN